MAGKAGQRELEAAGHLASTGRKRKQMNAGAPISSSFVFSPGPQPVGCCCLYLINPVENPSGLSDSRSFQMDRSTATFCPAKSPEP